MRRFLFIVFVTFFLFPTVSISQALKEGWKNYQDLGENFINSVFNNDTTAFSKFGSQELWIYIMDCEIKNGDTSFLEMETAIRKEYGRFFKAVYTKYFQKLGAEFIGKGISRFAIKSMQIEEDKTGSSPCKDLPQYNLSIYLQANESVYKNTVPIVEFKKRWYIVGPIAPYLYKQ